MTTALVTGAAGFTGRHLSHALAMRGAAVIGCGRLLTDSGSSDWIDYRAVDVTDRETVARSVREIRPDWIFHLAGRAQGASAELERVNLGGTLNVLRAALDVGCAVLVVGSAAEYGPETSRSSPVREDMPCVPVTAYGATKLAATEATLELVRKNELKGLVVRPFNLVGAGVPSHTVIGSFLHKLEGLVQHEEPPLRVEMGSLEAWRDYLAVDDAVGAYCDLMEKGALGGPFNVCSGNATRVRALIDHLVGLSELPVEVQEKPTSDSDLGPLCSYGSYERLAGVIGFRPSTPLDKALDETWDAAMKKVA